MTAPVWMAFPPEVHSALLSSGPGPGGLLAAAASWSSLSATYAAVAEELSSILAAVQAGAWEGPSAERYVAAHVPYLAWLMRASATSATEAAQHETAATAYTVALAAMPTLPELAANHAIHGVLVATNFFGINTIPIALNEADYARMWIQAATTMSTYHAVATAAVASAPHTDPAPQIVNSSSTHVRPDDGKYGGGGSSDQGILPIVDNDEGGPWDLSWWINRFLEGPETLIRDIELFAQNPIRGLIQLWYDIGGVASDEFGHALQAIQTFPQLAAVPFVVPASPGSAAGFAALTGLVGSQPEAAPAVAAAPIPEAPSVPVAGSSPAVSAAAAAPAPSSAPGSAPAPAPAAAPATGAPPPPPTGIEGVVYPYLVGGPTLGGSMSMSSSAQRKASEPDAAAAAAAAAASAREKQRARRRRRGAMKDRYRGYEFMDLDSDNGAEPDPFADAEKLVASAVASGAGAGPLGFAGTAHKEADIPAAGLATLAGDGFGGGPSVPMVPGTWEADQREPGEGETSAER
jgi:PPE-repeat protein